VRIDPAFARELYKGCHVIVEALDEAEAKAMFIETCLEAFPEIPVVAASGLAGLGHFESIRILHRGMLHICGDFENEVSRESPPVASRVAIVANLEADLALDLLLSSAPTTKGKAAPFAKASRLHRTESQTRPRRAPCSTKFSLPISTTCSKRIRRTKSALPERAPFGRYRDTLMGLEPRVALDASRDHWPGRPLQNFRKLPETFQVDIAELLDSTDRAALVRSLDPDDGVRLIKAIPGDRSEAVLSLMDKKESVDIRKMARYATGTAGSLMTTKYLAMSRDTTAGDCLERIRLEGRAARSIFSVFALGDEGILEGSVFLANLIQATPGQKLSDIMETKPLSIAALNDSKEAFYLFTHYDLVSLPVVDAEGVLIGLITHDDMVAALEQERTADMERFMAVSGVHDNTPYLHTTVWQNFRNRIGWLIIFRVYRAAIELLQSFDRHSRIW